MRPPTLPPQLAILLLVLLVLIAVVQIGLIRIAFDKLGLSPQSAMLLVLCSLLGSAINLPLFSVRTLAPIEDNPVFRGWLLAPSPPQPQRTMIAINVGGGIMPLAISLYLIQHHSLGLGQVALAITLVSLICYRFSRPIRGLGIGMPLLVAPLSAALVAWFIAPAHSAPLAYVCGTLGVLIGADVLRLRDIRNLGTPFASIGGAGTFDGIFLTGIVAALLA